MAASGAQGAGLGGDGELDDHPGAHHEGGHQSAWAINRKDLEY